MKKSNKPIYRNVFLGLVLLEALSAGGVWIFKTVANGPARPPVVVSEGPPFDFEVDYTDAGYSPAYLDVPLGSRVAFHNASSHLLWTAADPPRSHTDLPAFNAGRDYAPHETYIFRFDNPGTYGFGNDRQVANRGAIRVRSLEDRANDDKTPPEQADVRNQLLAMLIPGDPKSIFRVIDAIEADKDLAQSCHSLAHDLGHRAYELYGFSGAMNVSDSTRLSLASVQDVCAGGYVHGLLEEAARFRQDFDTNPQALCTDVPETSVKSCYHGLGHAFMFASFRDYATSLDRCRTFDGDKKAACFEGVWMELFWSKTKESEINLGWNPNKPLEPCETSQEDAKQACYLYSAFGYLRSHSQDYAGALQLCTTSGLGVRDTRSCVGGVGILMIGHFGGQHLEQAEPYAETLTPAAKKAFYRGMLNYAGFSGVTHQSLKDACAAMTHDGPTCSEVLETPDSTT